MALYRNFHVSPIGLQRGGSLGSFFTGLVKGLVPWGKKLLGLGTKVATSKVAKRVGKEALSAAGEAARSTLATAIEGGDTKATFDEELAKSRKRVGQALRKQEGEGGVKRWRPAKKKKKLKMMKKKTGSKAKRGYRNELSGTIFG